MEKPAIGTKMYCVAEHFYYVPSHAGPILEYCVVECEVIGSFERGFTEVHLRGRYPEGRLSLHYYKLSEIGTLVFYTPEEAAALAQAMTEKFEKTWGCIETPDIPMRRSWEKWLQQPAEGE